MYSPEHIASLLSIIAEQRSRITKLENDLAESQRAAERNWRWFTESEAKLDAIEIKPGDTNSGNAQTK